MRRPSSLIPLPLSLFLLHLLLLLCCSNLVSAIICPSSAPAVAQNCYLFLSVPVPLALPSTANPYTSRYDCALALGHYIPCVVAAANASFASSYAALTTTPCLVGPGPPSLVNHSAVTVVEVDSLGHAGLSSNYRHDNSTLNGNIGSCVGSVYNAASAAVSSTGAQCCSSNIYAVLTPIAQAALTTIQNFQLKSTYTLTPINAPVPPNAVQTAQAATGHLFYCPYTHPM